MNLNAYYEKIHKTVETFILDKGFQRESSETLTQIGDVWSGNLEVSNNYLGIYLVIPKFFPDRLPRVYFKKSPSAPMPHLGSDLFVCTIREPGLVYDQDKFLELIDIIIDRAKKTIADGISGKNHSDFDKEFLDYWRIESNGELISLLNPADDLGRIIVADVSLEKNKKKVVAKSIEEISKYFLKINPKYKVTYYHGAQFVKLENIPRPPFPNTITDAERILLPQSKLQIKKYKKSIPKGFKAAPYVIFSAPGEQPLLACWGETFRGRQHQLRKNIIERWDFERIQMRIGNQKNILQDLNICIIGCGSIGSHVSMGLIAAGAKNLVLIDSDKLEIGNIARHLCGASYIEQDKVEATKKYIEQHFPYAEIIPIAKDALEIFANDISQIVSCDLIISAVGELNINRRLNMLAYNHDGFPPVIFSFIESYGIASHALLVNVQSGGCFECALDEKLNFKYCVADFGDTQPEMQEAGCQTAFMPYSCEDTKMAASIVIRQVIDLFLSDHSMSQHKVWIGNIEDINRLGIKRNPLYENYQSFAIYTKNHGRMRDCKICKDND